MSAPADVDSVAIALDAINQKLAMLDTMNAAIQRHEQKQQASRASITRLEQRQHHPPHAERQQASW